MSLVQKKKKDFLKEEDFFLELDSTVIFSLC